MTRTHPALLAVVFLALALLYLPLFAVGVCSLNGTRWGVAWHGATLAWYESLLHDEAVLRCAWNTLVVACASTAIATVLGTFLALGLERFPWPRRTREGMLLLLELPVVMPDIVFAAALVVANSVLRLVSTLFDPGLATMVVGHVTFQIAFVALVVRSRLATLGPTIDEAARDLYAKGLDLFRRVTLPLVLPGVLAGAMLAFTLSLDDFVISFFTSGPTSTTLPIYIYASVRRGVSPEIHALSTLVMLLTVTLIVAAERVLAWREA